MQTPAITQLTSLTGVGVQIAEKLNRLGIHSSSDLLFHLPLRYEDRTTVTDIGVLSADSYALVLAQIELAQVVYGRRRSLIVRVSDSTGFLDLRLFYFSRAQEKSFRRGAWISCYGQARYGPNGLEMIHPQYRIFASQPASVGEASLTPVYPVSDGINQKLIRKLIDQAIARHLPEVVELLDPQHLPGELWTEKTGLSVAQAIHYLHRPPASASVNDLLSAQTPAHKRLVIEELIAHHFSLRQAKDARRKEQAMALPANGQLKQKFLQQLEFSLTQAQSRVEQEIDIDLQQTTPMMRLVQGDVGSGKTVVAALAILNAIENQVQSVFMAPTELLAEQHFRTLSQWFTELAITPVLLTGKTKTRQREKILCSLANGETLVAVGTHALFQQQVDYAKLALLIIDEQHRFGVNQRLALRNKTHTGNVPHTLLMTATPIPRTLAMTYYADLDVSSIDQMPPGRQPVNTVVLPAQSRRDKVVQRVAQACNNGRQVYWVCPLIEQSETLAAQAASEVYEQLSEALHGIRVGLVHGRLKNKEKEAAMSDFRNGKIQLLVATTVIEVGVDVANASLMVIENAERLGLSQLHQLRGRVGRGADQSFCLLLYQAPLGQLARQRLQIMRQSNDGFVIAEKDLELRGAGELLGTRQTGLVSFKVADISRDQALLPSISKACQLVLEQRPDVVPLLIERWIANRQAYANA